MTDPQQNDESKQEPSRGDDAAGKREPGRGKSKILIGSQRDAAERILAPRFAKSAVSRPPATEADDSDVESTEVTQAAADKPQPATPDVPPTVNKLAESSQPSPVVSAPATPPVTKTSPQAIPDEVNATDPGEPEMSLDDEIAAALGDLSIESMLDLQDDGTMAELSPDSRVSAKVTRIHGDNVFVSLPGRCEGVVSLRQFATPPTIGASQDVVIKRFSDEDGLYEVAVPGASVDVADWSDLALGAMVEAKITGSNTGGLECQVNNIRGFIPASQIDLYRVEQFGDFVGQKLQCIVTESNESRQKLVVSRRAVLEREKEARRQQLLGSLQVGQTFDGVVMKLMDFGAFVDIGGVEGLVHISKLSWDRVTHPSEVLSVGQKIKVKVDKLVEGGKISLSFRDTLSDPWESIEQKYPVDSIVRGRVTKIAQFGAFVKLEPGIEGLVHISELAHHRVFAVKNVVHEGDEVDVKVLSIDREAQRMSLSIKQTMAQPEPSKAQEEVEDDSPAQPSRSLAVPPRSEPLKGGRNRSSGGEQFGLNW